MVVAVMVVRLDNAAVAVAVMGVVLILTIAVQIIKFKKHSHSIRVYLKSRYVFFIQFSILTYFNKQITLPY
jgi:hypothetical protein